eukprot:4733-Amphidinium_carterae.2
MPNGARGTMTSTFHRWIGIRGEGWHCVDAPKKGIRWSVSMYSAGSLHLLQAGHWNTLVELGFPLRRTRSMYITQQVSSLQEEKAILMAIVDDKSNKEKSAPLAGDYVDEPDPWLAWPELYTEVYDNITGRELPAELVVEACREEMRFLHDLDAYEVVPIEQSYTAMGRAPLPVGWVDVNKGDEKHPKIRSRLVVKETRRNSPLQDAAAIFSSTPPFESLRFLASLAMTRQPDGARVDKTLLFIDITRAHPHCHVTRELYIALPSEDPASTSGKSCGRLKRCLYGTRDAGRSFELFVYEVMTERLGIPRMQG